MSPDETTFTRAILRQPGSNFARGITTSKVAEPVYSRMVTQHQSYADLLRSRGLEIVLLEALDDFPDAYFVEDTAVVMPEMAVISRPGATGRQGRNIVDGTGARPLPGRFPAFNRPERSMAAMC